MKKAVRAEPVEAPAGQALRQACPEHSRRAQGERGFERGPFVFPIRVYWEDTDAGGIVFYANYLKFFERARTEWLRSLGIEQSRLRETTGGMFVVGETSVRYHRAARLDDELLVTAAAKEIGRASLIIAQQAFLRDGKDFPAKESLLCEGTIRIGWVEAGTLKPARIPPMILEALNP